MKYFLKIIGVTLLMLSNCALVQAQNFGGGGGFGSNFGSGAGGFGGSSGGGSQTLVQDTSAIYYFYADNPNIVFPFRDSFLLDFQQYDPIRQQSWDWMSLGQLGAAAHPLVHQPTYRKGITIGLQQYDLYQLKTEDVKFYKVNQAYTQAYFSQGANQDNALFKLRFGRSFAKGVSLSIEHYRINDQGYYDHEEVDTRGFAMGLQFKGQGGFYESYASVVSNNVEVQDNGGEQAPFDEVITETDTLQVPIFIPAFQLDVNTSAANTRQTNRTFAYAQYFYLNKRKKRSKTKENPAPALLDSLSNGIDSLRMPMDSIQLDSFKLFPPKDTFSFAPSGRPQISPFAPASGGSNPFAQRATGNAPPVNNGPDFTQKRAFTVFHQIKYRTDEFKFWDNNLAADSSFYGNYQVDSRGVRHYIEARMLENVFKLQTFKLRKDQKDRRNTTQNDLIEVGLRHQMHWIDQAVDTSLLQNLFLTGSIQFSPNDRLKINTEGQLGLLNQAGDYRLSGELFLDFKTVGKLKIDAVNQLYEPTLIQHRFFNTFREEWNNDFSKTLETSITGTYSLPKLAFAASGGYHLLTNYIYFDENTAAQQSNEVISIFQLGAEKNFRFGPIGLNNKLVYQKATSDNIRLPELYSNHSLFFEGRIFKKAMLARIGLDARLMTGYQPYAYSALTGQFHLQNEVTTEFIPLVDFFFIFKLTRFRFFFKLENMIQGFTQTYYQQTAGYRLPWGSAENGGMRLGLSWRFVD